MIKPENGELKLIKNNYYDSQLKVMNYFTEGKDNSDIFCSDVDKMNKAMLKDFYKAVDFLLSKGYEEYVELQSRTLNPAQQNAFLPLREYRVKRNGHYKLVNIYTRFLGGCWIEEREI